jgi:hypothetical protein
LPPPPPLCFEFSWRKLWRCVPRPSSTLRVLPACRRSPALTPSLHCRAGSWARAG